MVKKLPASFLMILMLWLGWAIVLLGFQAIVTRRLELARPDYALSWTPNETKKDSQNDKPYLLVPYLNTQVSWDSEFYLSIAVAGYDDPTVRTTPSGRGVQPLPLNYAFFPLYPTLMGVLALPLRWTGMAAIPAATLAGLVVSLLGALGAAWGLFVLGKNEVGDDAGGFRTAFYLLIFPAGFFLAQIYTEGLFLGLVFACLALLSKRQWLGAAILAALASITRPGGSFLVIPLAWAWLSDRPWSHSGAKRLAILQGLAVFAPVAAYLAWNFSTLGQNFWAVEKAFFGRQAFAILPSLNNWLDALKSLSGKNPEAQVYYALELGAVLLAILSCLLTLRRHPGISLFGLAVIGLAFFSASPQGMIRYVMAAPSLFMVLGKWGKNPAFDRVWTVLSLLLFGMLVTLFSFDFWVA